MFERILVGAEATGWQRTANDDDQSLVFGSIVLLWYPQTAGALFLKAGIGGLHYSATSTITGDVVDLTAPAGSLGLGYEFRVTRNMSFMPFGDVLFTSPVKPQRNGMPFPTTEDMRVSMVQLGVGLTWH